MFKQHIGSLHFTIIIVFSCGLKNVVYSDSEQRYGQFRSSYRPLIGRRSVKFSETSVKWKTTAVTDGSLFMGYYFASTFHHRYYDFNSNYSNRICYNKIFSGPNNQPIYNVTDLNDIQSHANEDELEKDTPSLLISDDDYSGLFLCPLTYEQIGKTYCCGPRDAEYCCSFWQTDDIKLSLFFFSNLTILVTLFIIIQAHKKKLYCFSNNQQENNNQQQQDILHIPESQPLTGPALALQPFNGGNT